MLRTQTVRDILARYDGERPGIKTNSRRIDAWTSAGTGKMVILPVDQGFEHGPARSFAPNPAAYDPHYLFQLAMRRAATPRGALGLLEREPTTSPASCR